MWQAGGYNIQAFRQAKWVEKRRQFLRDLRQQIHYKRMPIHLKILEAATEQPLSEAEGSAILNDLTELSLKIFTPTEIQPGTLLDLGMEASRRVYLRARVVWCYKVPRGNMIVSSSHMDYRVGLELIFHSKEENATFLRYRRRLFFEHLHQEVA